MTAKPSRKQDTCQQCGKEKPVGWTIHGRFELDPFCTTDCAKKANGVNGGHTLYAAYECSGCGESLDVYTKGCAPCNKRRSARNKAKQRLGDRS